MNELAVDTSALALREPVWLLGLSKRETQRCRATRRMAWHQSHIA